MVIIHINNLNIIKWLLFKNNKKIYKFMKL